VVLVSNSGHFDIIIRQYEYSKPTAIEVFNAKGFSVYYSPKEFAKALVIIDPRGYESAENLLDIPSFYAHRELEGDDILSKTVKPVLIIG
jgi:hypothetical protein